MVIKVLGEEGGKVARIPGADELHRLAPHHRETRPVVLPHDALFEAAYVETFTLDELKALDAVDD